MDNGPTDQDNPPTMTIPAFHGNIDFNAQHSPIGAFMSFTCGSFGKRGGFGFQIGKPGNQDIYIGLKDGDRFSDSPLKCLPFYQGAESKAADAFLVEQAGPAEQNVKPKITAYQKDQIKRHYGWATDRWATADFDFAIYTPFFPMPEPKDGYAMMFSIIPAVIAELTIDNTAGKSPKTAFFALGFSEPGARLFNPQQEIVGFAWRRQLGVRAVSSDPSVKPFSYQRWTVDQGLIESSAHGLGTTAGVGITIPVGKKITLRLALGSYLEGVQTTGIDGEYLYKKAFGSLERVLDAALDKADHLIDQATRILDDKLLKSGLSPDQQFLIAHSTRSYHGSTQLLDVGGEPFWIVNEGEYCMMNTLDLSVDQVFWELSEHPWVVKNLLDNFARHYSYVDEVKRDGKRSPGGISFSHDMGIHNNFSSRGNSSYELPELNALCFSYMTAEQLCNWSLMAATYVLKTNDLNWAKQNLHTIAACVASLQNRGGDAGFVQFDSSRCGDGGAEITTYDSLDHSLAQTRNNVYMAVKCWASYYGLALVLEKLNDARAKGAFESMSRVERELLKHAGENGIFPAVFEKENSGYTSRILPAIEGLMYPLYWSAPIPQALSDALKKHTLALLKDPDHRNVFADGGIKLSSTSNNSWMSKIAIFMHIAREALKLDDDPKIKELFAKADAAHVKWQTDGSGYWACSDQFVSGVAQGSRYYPRIITTALWMK